MKTYDYARTDEVVDGNKVAHITLAAEDFDDILKHKYLGKYLKQTLGLQIVKGSDVLFGENPEQTHWTITVTINN